MITTHTRSLRQYISIAILATSFSVFAATVSSIPTHALSLKDVLGGLLPATSQPTQKDRTNPLAPIINTPTQPVVITPRQVTPQQQPAPTAQEQMTNPVSSYSAQQVEPIGQTRSTSTLPLPLDTSIAVNQLAVSQTGHAILPISYSSSKISQTERDKLYAVGIIGLLVGATLYLFSYTLSRRWAYVNVVGPHSPMIDHKQ